MDRIFDYPFLHFKDENAIKVNPENKSTVIDGITTEPPWACGENGIMWLVWIFTASGKKLGKKRSKTGKTA